MSTNKEDRIRKSVRKRYGKIAETGGKCGISCCSDSPSVSDYDKMSKIIGYSDKDLETVPDGSNMALGCGNPQAIAKLKKGEVVLDLGSGGGLDCFLAAKKVGETGRVIGIDMTPEMIKKAKANAKRGGYKNVEFRKGNIEKIPVEDGTVNVIISNCVINLSPDKPAVFREAFRVLGPGGRLAISDIVATKLLPESMRSDDDLFCGCIGGAATVDDIRKWLKEIGFKNVKIETHEESRKIIKQWFAGTGVEKYVVSASIKAVKP